jgi:hypothetical protein
MMARQTALPPALAPRLVGLAKAAAYVDASPNTFRRMVVNGTMPAPKMFGPQEKWDLREIDRAVDELPIKAASGASDDTWGDVDHAA